MKSRILFHKKLLHSYKRTQALPRASTFFIKNISNFETRHLPSHLDHNLSHFKITPQRNQISLAKSKEIIQKYSYPKIDHEETSYNKKNSEKHKKLLSFSNNKKNKSKNASNKKTDEKPTVVKEVISDQYSQFDVDSKLWNNSIVNYQLAQYTYKDNESQTDQTEYEPQTPNSLFKTQQTQIKSSRDFISEKKSDYKSDFDFHMMTPEPKNKNDYEKVALQNLPEKLVQMQNRIKTFTPGDFFLFELLGHPFMTKNLLLMFKGKNLREMAAYLQKNVK